MGQLKEKYSIRFAQGETKLARLVFSILDICLLPNLHDVIKAVNKKHPHFTFKEKVMIVLRKLDWDRTLYALIFGVLFWFDVITWDMLVRLLVGAP